LVRNAAQRVSMQPRRDEGMNSKLQLAIRGGLVMDGMGGTPFRADLGIRDGRIVAIGELADEAEETIDATGKLVTPGFVDIHTHYDGQAIWSSRFLPSSKHGVTTVVMGNCGVGFAPVKPTDHERLIQLMEGVEDIPGVALSEGLDWAWESFPEFLTALERRPHDIDFCAYLPHAPLRVYVMGERATRLEKATPEDIARMRKLAAEAVRLGAIGFSSSRSINHRSATGDAMPSLHAAEEELTGIALGLKDAGRGVLQIILDFDDASMIEEEFSMLRRIVEVSGRPLSYSLMQKHGNKEGWRKLLALTAKAAADGLPIRAQIAPRLVGVLLSLEGSRNIFIECPSYLAIKHLPLSERVERLRDPVLRAKLIAELRENNGSRLSRRLTEFENIFPLGDPPNYNPGPGASIAAEALAKGIDPVESAYDYHLRDNGRFLLMSPFANYADQDLEACADMIADPHTLIGLGDGGAHVGLVSDSSFPTFLLTHWTDRDSRAAFTLPALIKRQTHDTARAVGLLDRGTIAVGMKADLNVIDVNALDLGSPEMFYDLPSDAGRFMQKASGYCATVVSGNVVYRDGQAEERLPGRLVRVGV
jgi:N-acyl-D-aspartate/D-glutamate deacylase